MKINLKELVLGILTATSGIAIFWSWHEAMPRIAEGRIEGYISFILPVAGLIIAAVLFSLSSLFVKNNWILYPAVIIGLGAPYLFISATGLIIGMLLTIMALASLAVHRIRKEIQLSLGFSLPKTLKTGLPLFFTISSLIVSAYFLTQLDEEKAISALLPKPALISTLKLVSGPLGSLTGLPKTLNPEATLDEAILELITGQLQSQGVDILKLPQQELSRVIYSQRAELAKSLGIKLTGEERVADLLYDVITKRLEDLLGPYKIYLPFASAAAFFFAFKTLTFPLYYATLLITFLLIKLMIATTILKSEKVQIEVERLTL